MWSIRESAFLIPSGNKAPLFCWWETKTFTVVRFITLVTSLSMYFFYHQVVHTIRMLSKYVEKIPRFPYGHSNNLTLGIKVSNKNPRINIMPIYTSPENEYVPNNGTISKGILIFLSLTFGGYVSFWQSACEIDIAIYSNTHHTSTNEK